jgi:hypothetical protein
MWEDLTIALSCAGFAAAIAVMLCEPPAVLRAAEGYARSRHQRHP